MIPTPLLAAEEMTREVFADVHGVAKIAFYLLGAATTAVFAAWAWKRVKKYRRGRPTGRLPELWWQTRYRNAVRATRRWVRSISSRLPWALLAIQTGGRGFAIGFGSMVTFEQR